MTKEAYMEMALSLAKKGTGYTDLNPLVGCVVVKEDQIIATGYHERYGGYHAERNALLGLSREEAKGAELYVTLEPCCHYGKTPPCTEIIIEKGIKKVYIGAMDNNPLVAGKGVAQLKEAGVEVETGILKEECEKSNEVFFHYMQTKLPFVAMKYAMTLDGKIACESGDSKWVTSEESRNQVQLLRKEYKGIMVGIETVLADDPLLTCRIEPACNPVRIICDSRLRLPLDSQIVKTAHEVRTYVAYAKGAVIEKEKKEQLALAGIKLLCAGQGSQLDVSLLIKLLSEEGINGILLEGGGTLNASMLRAGLVSRVYAYLAPKFVMGQQAKGPVMGEGIKKMADAILMTQTELFPVGEDILITGRIGDERTCLPD